MPLRLVQITDTHLFADPSDTLKGVATQASLDTVIDTCRIEHPTPDLILLTGDLSQDGSNATYRRIAHACEPLPPPCSPSPATTTISPPCAIAVSVTNANGCYRGGTS